MIQPQVYGFFFHCHGIAGLLKMLNLSLFLLYCDIIATYLLVQTMLWYYCYLFVGPSVLLYHCYLLAGTGILWNHCYFILVGPSILWYRCYLLVGWGSLRAITSLSTFYSWSHQSYASHMIYKFLSSGKSYQQNLKVYLLCFIHLSMYRSHATYVAHWD